MCDFTWMMYWLIQTFWKPTKLANSTLHTTIGGVTKTTSYNIGIFTIEVVNKWNLRNLGNTHFLKRQDL